jgi:hypothetical protein
LSFCDSAFIFNLHTSCSFSVYTVLFNGINMSSFVRCADHVYNVFHIADSMSTIY